jgi:hypothetical protein
MDQKLSGRDARVGDDSAARDIVRIGAIALTTRRASDNASTSSACARASDGDAGRCATAAGARAKRAFKACTASAECECGEATRSFRRSTACRAGNIAAASKRRSNAGRRPCAGHCTSTGVNRADAAARQCSVCRTRVSDTP